jgi:glycerol-3-phosphate dehydrogenase (NAD(P)+)
MVLSHSAPVVVIWSHDADYAPLADRARENTKFLPGVRLPEKVRISANTATALEGADLLVSVVPSRFLRSALNSVKPFYHGIPVVSATKGIESSSLLTSSEVVRQVLAPSRIAAISGPSHAEEVARGLPATVVIASEDTDLVGSLQRLFNTPSFRVYTNNDIRGVELCGATKNVIAIAAGICDGMKLGDNAKSALITRGMAEIGRFITALGGSQDTVSGLAGIGDLITTCISPFGRNRKVGMLLAAGRSLAEITEGMETVAEGVTTARAIIDIARSRGVEMPICEEVCRVLFDGKSPHHGVADLMSRELKSEGR